MTDEYSVVLTTTDSVDEADRLAKGLVEAKLAACVQLSAITSHYVWDGAATKSDEILLLIKTRRSKTAAIQAFIRENHSYDTPELVELPIISGSAKYLAWIDDVTR